MSLRRVASPPPAQLLRTVLAALLAAMALPAAAAQGSLLEITVGPHETTWLEPKDLKVLLDGAPLSVIAPAPGADPALPVHSDVLAPGKHKVSVEAAFVGNSQAFSYLQGYVFQMKGELDIDAPPAEAVGVNVKVVTKSGLTVEWTDKFQLALKAGKYPSERAAAAQVPDARQPAAALAVAAGAKKAKADSRLPEVDKPEPVPASFVKREGAGACTVEPPRFAFARHGLDAGTRARLDEFATCLRDSGDAVVIGGHADPRGSARYNEWLSAERASEVLDYLVKRGVPRSRLATHAYGSTRLVCKERTEACNARNRRAEALVSRP